MELHDGDGMRVPSRFTMRHQIPVTTPSGLESLTVGMHESYHYDKRVLFPDFEFIASRGYENVLSQLRGCRRSFASKRNTIIFRGSSTGYVPKDTTTLELERNDRIRASISAKAWHPLWDVGLTDTVQISPQVARRLAYMNLLRPPMSLCEVNQYKGVLDVDGNTNSWRGFFLKLHMNSIVYKVESHLRQWYYHELTRGINYVPVDLSNLSATSYGDTLVRHEHVIQSNRMLVARKQSALRYDYVEKMVVGWWRSLDARGRHPSFHR